MEQILASHSQVYGAGELYKAEAAFADLPSLAGYPKKTTFDAINNVTTTHLEQLAGIYLSWLEEINSDRMHIVDKMPQNYLYLGLLAALFPRATFIHAQRDLRDVALSAWITSFKLQSWTHDPAHITSRFEQYLRLMEHWRKVLPPGLINDWSYEDIVTNGEAAMRRLVEEKAGLHWEPQCMDFHKTSRTVQTASLVQVRQPLYKGSMGRWQQYQTKMPELFVRLRCSEVLAACAPKTHL